MRSEAATSASRTPPWLVLDGDVGVGVFPEGEKVLVAAAGTQDCVIAATIHYRAAARCRILRGCA
jgi:hypothetical protein